MSPMASPTYEANRLGNKGLELMRLLELVLRDSRAIDVEALCIRSGKEVWKIRIDVRVLDDDGGLVDCASLAANAALRHFARPDCTVSPEGTLIHSPYDKALVPLSIYHMPVCVTFGISSETGTILVDPSDREAQYLDGCLIVSCNKRKEVCVLHQSNSLTLTTGQIMNCVRRAIDRTVDLSELVNAVVAHEAKQRGVSKEEVGFDTALTAELLTSKEAVPNELIALPSQPPDHPILTGTETVVGELNMLAEGSVKLEDHENEIEEQVGVIISNVGAVAINETVKRETQKSKVVPDRQREMDDISALLDDLDGDTLLLPGSDSVQEPVINLAAAKKKRKK